MDVGFFFLGREKHAPKKEAKPRTNGNAFCGHVAVAVDIHLYNCSQINNAFH